MKKRQILRSTLPALAVFALSLAGCRSAQQAQPDFPRVAPGVTMQDVTFFSAALKRKMPYRVYLPAKLVPGRNLPVVYLLHGGGANFQEWSNYSDVARYAAPDGSGGLILVMPEGAFSYFMNAVEKPEDRYEDYLVNDLISDVEARFPAARGRQNRAAIGISMGGFAAIKLALSRPELFVFVGAFSPAIDAAHRRLIPIPFWRWRTLRTIFGPWGSKTRQVADPFVLVYSANPAVTPYLYLTSGETDPLLQANRRFAALLYDRHFSYEFHTQPGGHDWDEWDSRIPGCFESLLHYLHPPR